MTPCLAVAALDLSLKSRVLTQLRKSWAELLHSGYDGDGRDEQLILDERRQVQAHRDPVALSSAKLRGFETGRRSCRLSHTHVMRLQVRMVRYQLSRK